VGFFNKWLSTAVDAQAQAQAITSDAAQVVPAADNPISRTLGPHGAEQVRQMLSGLSRFGINLDADDALGQQTEVSEMQNPFKRIHDPVEGSMHVVGCTALDRERCARRVI
jgi:hypothetical protein